MDRSEPPVRPVGSCRISYSTTDRLDRLIWSAANFDRQHRAREFHICGEAGARAGEGGPGRKADLPSSCVN